MAVQNDFLTWALGIGANVLSQAAYAANPAQNVGVSAGEASSSLYNKTARQAAFIISALAQFTADGSGIPSLDDGSMSQAAFIANMKAAILALLPPVLTSTQNVYVNGTSGNDANDGLTPATSFRTITHAVAVVQGYNFNGHSVTINVAPGTYAGVISVGATLNGSISFQVYGVGTVIVTATNTNCFNFSSGAVATIGDGFQLSATGSPSLPTSTGCAVLAGFGSTVFLGNVIFGTCTNIHIVGSGGIITLTKSYQISGAAGIAHIHTEDGGEVTSFVGVVATVGASLAFATFAECTKLGIIDLPNWSFAGGSGVTGQRYNAALNAIINTGGGGPSFFPGNLAGAVGTGGQYV